MVNVVWVKPLVRGRPLPKGRSGAFASCNLKRSSRCRFAVGAAGCNILDNYTLQDRQAPFGQMRLEPPLKFSGRTGRNRRQHCSPN